MRSKVSHFSGIIRFIIFVVVILLLIYVVVHWSRQNKHEPVATNPSSSSQTANNSKEAADSNAKDSKTQTDKPKSSNSDKPSPKPAAPSNKSTSKPAQIAGDTSAKPPKTKPQPVTNAVPSTGLGLEQAVVATTGIGLTVYLVGNYWQTRKWYELG